MHYQIVHYLTAGKNKDPYIEWLHRLHDNTTKVAVIRRVARIGQGNFGDHKYCRKGVRELRIDTGPGYRVYYAVSGHRVVLLCRGDKHTQSTDIHRAIYFWNDWNQRGSNEKQTK
ncbi:type II toxin-antitoxin system RelE/ParE family toxin [Pusillimonas sp. ANT_WB101]|uniref:type II toxin-antitoxin system RelE/ParE family toxin n=1 Tax=Pusillimonas sp. ANT_WB101 TaxID=2597356 RepID=UPI0011EFC2EE|nr:type II toxin-antitoxin system RelE/ParE family toxin [Pusillimonas sp. ANT_WB101]KAA0891142.1 type II toxin-antitoxin system RelE/ParE family toxin [Pusillimonas sp. ANT_WB101]